jgi:hypothetical protein
MIFPRWALSADKRLPLAGPRSIRTGLRRLISAQESRGATTALGAGAFGPARRRSPVVGAWFSSRLQPSIPLAPTSSICRLLNADARPFRGASQGSEGSSPPRTPRRTASAHSRPGFEPFSGGFRSIMDALLPSSSVVHRFRCSCRERPRPWPQSANPPQDLGEQGSGHRHLG